MEDGRRETCPEDGLEQLRACSCKGGDGVLPDVVQDDVRGVRQKHTAALLEGCVGSFQDAVGAFDVCDENVRSRCHRAERSPQPCRCRPSTSLWHIQHVEVGAKLQDTRNISGIFSSWAIMTRLHRTVRRHHMRRCQNNNTHRHMHPVLHAPHERQRTVALMRLLGTLVMMGILGTASNTSSARTDTRKRTTLRHVMKRMAAHQFVEHKALANARPSDHCYNLDGPGPSWLHDGFQLIRQEVVAVRSGVAVVQHRCHRMRSQELPWAGDEARATCRKVCKVSCLALIARSEALLCHRLRTCRRACRRQQGPGLRCRPQRSELYFSPGKHYV